MRARVATLAVAGAVASSACAPQHADAPSAQHGFQTAGIGVGHLVLSPFMIAAGLLEGIATLPYFVAADLHALNRAMVESHAAVDLERTYRHAYAQPLDRVEAHGSTGVVFRHMSEATRHFQRVLSGYGVSDHDRFLLTAVRSADRDGFTLYAVVHRPAGPVRVRDARSGVVRTLGPGDRDYYRPYAKDADGRALDVVIDWAGVARTAIRDQKGQAILMTIAANSVLTNRRDDAYWAVERRWTGGDFRAVVAEREAYLEQRMGLAG